MIKQERQEALQKEYLHGKEAKQLLESPAFSRAIEAVRTDLIEGFIATSWRKRKHREEAHRQLQLLQRITDKLENELGSGKLAKKRLEAK